MAGIRTQGVSQTFRFAVKPYGPAMSRPQLEKLVRAAVIDAVKDFGTSDRRVTAKAQLEGGFGGLGEATVVLVLTWKALKAVGIAAALGVATAGGQDFYKRCLAPRLRKMNLLPANFRHVSRHEPEKPKKRTTRREK